MSWLTLWIVAGALSATHSYVISIPAFDAESYNATLQSIPDKSGCFLKTAISSFCWLCNSSAALRSRYLYKSRCARAFGSSSTVKMLPCPHTKQKNFCYMTCDSLGQKACCPNHYGPLCLSCPKDKPYGSYKHKRKGVCSNRAPCRAGVTGSGFCSCGHRFRGTACQFCKPGYYGKFCQYRCNCRNGYCLGGSNHRNCICKSGWYGTYCSRRISNCKDCGPNQRCTPSGCKCEIGFKGLNCTEEEDLCKEGTCSVYANCTTVYAKSQSRLKAHCTCWPGFKGDGHHCMLQNPCGSQVRCKSNEVCMIISREMPKCICRVGYERKNGTCVKKVCTQPELCPKNSYCKWAADHLNEQQCVCKSGYFRPNCLPSLRTIVNELHANPRYRGKIDMIRKLTLLTLQPHRKTLRRFCTLLLPIGELQRNEITYFSTVGINRHILFAFVNVTNGTYWNVYGDKLEFSTINATNSSEIGEVKVANVTLKILKKMYFTDGIAYMINGAIKNPFDKYQPKPGTKNITRYLEGISPLMANLYNPWVIRKRRSSRCQIIFSLKEFTKHEVEYLKSKDPVARYKLKYYLDSTVTTYRFSRYADPIVAYLKKTRYIPSRYGNNKRMKFLFLSNGQWHLDSIRVIVNYVQIGNCIIVLVDKPIPSSIVDPILPGQCHQKQTVTLKVPYPGKCPDGTKLISGGRWRKTSVCKREIIITRQCCPGFYGPSCEFHCPGPYGVPCYNNGKCYDGLKGDGKCYCKDPFSGLECEKCTSSDTFGPGCNKTCPCRRGICDSGSVFSTGKCKSCEPGFFGIYCDRKIIKCFNTTLNCGLNQHCESDEVSAPRCVCDQGYKRNKTGCYPFNPCLDVTRNRGGCQVNSVCKYLGPGNSTCVCKKGFIGDGFVCEKRWSFCKNNDDCKVNGSICVTGICRCANGRQMKDKRCDLKFNCSKNNGGCHPAAVCHANAPDYNSHCKCREGNPGDGFVCLETWTKALITHKVKTPMSIFFYARHPLLRRKKKPFTVFFPTNERYYNYRFRHFAVDGLYFVENVGKNYLFSDFFYNETPWKLNVTRKNNGAYVGNSRIIMANIHAKEGLVHVVDRPLEQRPTGVRMFRPTTLSPPAPVPPSVEDPMLAYPMDYKANDECSPPFKPFNQVMKITSTVHTSLFNFTKISRGIRRLLFIHGNAKWFGITFNSLLKTLTQNMRFCGSNAKNMPKASGCYVPFYTSLQQPLCPRGFLVKPIFHRRPPPKSFHIRFRSNTKFRMRHSFRGHSRINLTELITCCRIPTHPQSDLSFNGKAFNLIKFLKCPIAPGRLYTKKNYQPYDIFSLIVPHSFTTKIPKLDFMYVCHYFSPKRRTTSIVLSTSTTARPSTRTTKAPKPHLLAILIPTNHSCYGKTYTVSLQMLYLLRSRMPDYGPNPKYCVPKLKRFWPEGYSCGVEVQGRGVCRRRIPIISVTDNKHNVICCRRFPAPSKEDFELFRMKQPAFAIYRTSSYCSRLLGYKRQMITLQALWWRKRIICQYSHEDHHGFSLPQPVTGCNRGLRTGYIVQRLEKDDTRMPNKYLHLAGLVSHNKHTVKLEFCTSTPFTETIRLYKFPKGRYCIYRKGGLCMKGFVSSFAEIDDEDTLGPVSNVNRTDGAIPDGIWDYNISNDTRYYFCCRDDGNESVAVKFTFAKPFYLFKSPASKECQAVFGFSVRHEILRLDAEDKRKIGKPAVTINGSVPMTRSKIRGTDIDVHYCFYDNRPPGKNDTVLGVIKSGATCPDGFVERKPQQLGCNSLTSNQLCGNTNFSLCFVNKTSEPITWPSGAYCLFGEANKICDKNFYTMSLTSFGTGTLTICCRDDGPIPSKPLQFANNGPKNFGLIVDDKCPEIVGLSLISLESNIGLYTACYYSNWPNSVRFALPRIGSACHFAFQDTVLGASYLNHYAVASTFNTNFTHPNDYFLDHMRICASPAMQSSKKTSISWPFGRYCIFSDDKNVTKEFPFAVTFKKAVKGKGYVSATFIFCRDDSNTDSSLSDLPGNMIAVIAPDTCSSASRLKLKRQVLLRKVENGNADFELNEILHKGSPNSVKKPPQPKRLLICIYSRDTVGTQPKLPEVTFALNQVVKQSRVCNCRAHIAACSRDNLCLCDKNLIGDGSICQSCTCGNHATCVSGPSLFSRECQCLPGYHGNGLNCFPVDKIVKTKLGVLSDWPEGPFAFLQAYDNIKNCPPDFGVDESRLIGRFENFTYAVESKQTFCVKRSSESNNEWPEGNYCLWAYVQLCPHGLELVTISVPFNYFPYNGDDSMASSQIRDGKRVVVFHFCCKSSKQPAKELSFPAVEFLSLIRKDNECPKLTSMKLVEQRFLLARSSIELSKMPMDTSYDKVSKSLELHLCNYYIDLSERCEDCNVPISIVQFNMSIYAIINTDPILAEFREVLKFCKLWKKIEIVHHIFVTIFMDENTAKKMGNKNIDCDILKRYIIFSNKQMPMILDHLKNTTMFRSFSNQFTPITIQETNTSKRYLVNGLEFHRPPYVIAKNGILYLMKSQYSQQFNKRTSPSKRWIPAVVVLLLIIAAGLAVLAFIYIRRRRGMTSMMSYVNPVYYRPVEH